MTLPVPDGWRPLDRPGPYLAHLGPWHYALDARGQIVLGLRVEERHTNIRHIAHGGLLLSMVDTALGVVISRSRTPPQPLVTVSLTTNFVESAHPGDWIEAHVEITRVGGRLAYGTCALRVGDRVLMTATGVFALMKPVVKKEAAEG